MKKLDWLTSLVVGVVLATGTSLLFTLYYILPELHGFTLGFAIGNLGGLLILAFLSSTIVLMLLRFRGADLQEFKASLDALGSPDVKYEQPQSPPPGFQSGTFDFGGYKTVNADEEGL